LGGKIEEVVLMAKEGMLKMKAVAIIPTRMAATRFPNKPLAPILGLPMIEHVRRRVSMCKDLDDVIVATCDKEIREVVEAAGGKVIMTSDAHERCTDRIAEASRSINADIVINVQGDEPLVMPHMMTDVIRPLIDDSELVSVNLVLRIENDEEFENPNTCKVVTNRFGELLYISREPIPSSKIFTKLEPTPLEKIESVDMNRAVEHGYRVKIVETKGQMIGVDVPTDIKRVEEILKSDSLVEKYM
jgi:3-deoxy-manno-octulosonate cytidylyltransferase (CMP-KDO synthetase)